jgi:hypothetical protein
MTDSERLTKMIDGIHEAMGDSYRAGHRDATAEILGEAIHALQLRGNCDVAIAILKGMME